MKNSFKFKKQAFIVIALMFAMIFASTKVSATSIDVGGELSVELKQTNTTDKGSELIQSVNIQKKIGDDGKVLYDITVDILNRAVSNPSALPEDPKELLLTTDFQRSEFMPEAKVGSSLSASGKFIKGSSPEIFRYVFENYVYEERTGTKAFAFTYKDTTASPNPITFGPYAYTVPDSLIATEKPEIPENPKDPGLGVEVVPPGGNWEPTEPEKEKKEIASLKPHILVSSFNYGEKPITAGQQFTLAYTVKNYSKNITIQNIVIKLTTSEGLQIKSDTNTVFIDSLAPGASSTHNIVLKMPVKLDKDIQTVTLDSKFQYFDKKEEDPPEGEDQTIISIPSVKINRSKIAAIKVGKKFKEGKEGTLEYGVINNGFANIYNAEVFVYDEAGKEIGWEFIGNLEPGSKTDGKKMNMTFDEGGKKACKLVLTYEDENLVLKKDSKPFEIDVEIKEKTDDSDMGPGMEMPIPDGIVGPDGEPLPVDENGNPIFPDGEKKSNLPLYIGIGAGVIVLLVLFNIINKKRKNKKAKSYDDYFDQLDEVGAAQERSDKKEAKKAKKAEEKKVEEKEEKTSDKKNSDTADKKE